MGNEAKPVNNQWQGWWIVLLAFVFTWAPRFFFQPLDLSSRKDFTASGGTPWAEIQHAFNQGIGAAIGFALVGVLVAVTWKRYFTFSHMALWMAVLFNGGYVIQALVISRHCQNLFNPALATSSWQTVNEFFGDSWITTGAMLTASMIAVMIMIYPAIRKNQKNHNQVVQGGPGA